MNTLEHLVNKAQTAAQGGLNVLSTGEAVAAALILNRPDWLDAMGYTLAQAIDRLEPDWLELIPAAAKAMAASAEAMERAARAAKEEATLAALDGDDVVDVTATLVSYGSAPGYRNAYFTFDVRRHNEGKGRRLCFHVGPKDGESIVQHLIEVHRLAWTRGEPLDVRPGERRPAWIGGT